MTFHFRAFDPPTLETFAEHTRREVYRELRRAVADLRTEPHDSHEWHLGIAYARVTVLYDIGHPRAHPAMQRYERTRAWIRKVCEEKSKMAEEKPKLFKVMNRGEDVLGGAVSLDNVYISAYASYEGKHARELELEEGCWANYSLSGSKGRYFVVRVQ